jgi:hypothetical protein
VKIILVLNIAKPFLNVWVVNSVNLKTVYGCMKTLATISNRALLSSLPQPYLHDLKHNKQPDQSNVRSLAAVLLLYHAELENPPFSGGFS